MKFLLDNWYLVLAALTSGGLLLWPALQQTEGYGGRVLQRAHPIGPHGWRALVLDSEGNRIALHSTVDA